MSTHHFAISQTQWDVLEISNHPVQAAGALQAHPKYEFISTVNIPSYLKSASLFIAAMSSSRSLGYMTVYAHSVDS